MPSHHQPRWRRSAEQRQTPGKGANRAASRSHRGRVWRSINQHRIGPLVHTGDEAKSAKPCRLIQAEVRGSHTKAPAAASTGRRTQAIHPTNHRASAWRRAANQTPRIPTVGKYMKSQAAIVSDTGHPSQPHSWELAESLSLPNVAHAGNEVNSTKMRATFAKRLVPTDFVEPTSPARGAWDTCVARWQSAWARGQAHDFQQRGNYHVAISANQSTH